MKIALITTCIRPPRVLDLMRRYDPDVRFFVAGDLKSDDEEMLAWAGSMDEVVYLSADFQKKLNYKCSEVIGWNCIQRRALALLSALKWGAEIIVSHDDDNIPMDSEYFSHFEWPLLLPFSGFQISTRNCWVNQYGPIKHRGFPVDVTVSPPLIGTVVDAKIGVAAGVCLGDPDIDAYTRMANPQRLGGTDLIVSNGYAVAPNNKCVFNTQNTAYLRQFAPAMFCAPGLGRHDDIIASLLTQRVMKDAGYQVHIGQPFTYQERNHHDLLIDLKEEIWGYENFMEISEFIDRMGPADDVLTLCRYFWGGCAALPQQAQEAGLAFLEDCEAVL